MYTSSPIYEYLHDRRQQFGRVTCTKYHVTDDSVTTTIKASVTGMHPSPQSSFRRQFSHLPHCGSLFGGSLANFTAGFTTMSSWTASSLKSYLSEERKSASDNAIITISERYRKDRSAQRSLSISIHYCFSRSQKCRCPLMALFVEWDCAK